MQNCNSEFIRVKNSKMHAKRPVINGEIISAILKNEIYCYVVGRTQGVGGKLHTFIHLEM
jgi:hypothetical protein